MRGVAKLTAVLLAELASCSAPSDSRIDPTGPYPDAGRGIETKEESRNGYLEVDTPRIYVDQEGNPYDLPGVCHWESYHSVPTGYAVYDRGSRLVAEVVNHSSPVVDDEDPTKVAMAPGRYLVKLDRPDAGQ